MKSFRVWHQQNKKNSKRRHHVIGVFFRPCRYRRIFLAVPKWIGPALVMYLVRRESAQLISGTVWTCTYSSPPHKSWKSLTILGSEFEIGSASSVTNASALAGKGVGSEWQSDIPHLWIFLSMCNSWLALTALVIGHESYLTDKYQLTGPSKVIFEHIELPAKLLDYFSRYNKSNINQKWCVYCSESRIPSPVVYHLWRTNHHPCKSIRWECQLDTRNCCILCCVGPRLIVFCAEVKDLCTVCCLAGHRDLSDDSQFWRTRIRQFWAVWDWNLGKCLRTILRILVENLASHKDIVWEDSILVFVFIAFRTFAANQRCINIKNAFNKCYSHLVLKHCEHRQCCKSEECTNHNIWSDWCKLFEECRIFDLCKTFGYEFRSVSSDCTVFIYLVIENPSKAHNVRIVGQWGFGMWIWNWRWNSSSTSFMDFWNSKSNSSEISSSCAVGGGRAASWKQAPAVWGWVRKKKKRLLVGKMERNVDWRQYYLELQKQSCRLWYSILRPCYI